MSFPCRLRRLLRTGLTAAALTIGGMVLDASQPRPGYSAEQIRITAAGPLELTVSVDVRDYLFQFLRHQQCPVFAPVWAG